MTRSNAILLGILVAQLGLAVALHAADDPARIANLTAVMADLDTGAVEGIRIESSDDDDVLELARSADGWVLASHFDYPVDDSRVSALLDSVSGMLARGPMTTDAARHKQLEVSADAARRKLTLTTRAGERTVRVGAVTGARKTAVRIDDQPAVFAVSGLTPHAIGTAPTSWVDTTYFQAAADDVAVVVVDTPAGPLELRRADGTWQLYRAGEPVAPPPGKQLDTAAADALVRQLAHVRLTRPADPDATPTATTRVVVRIASDEPPAQDNADPAAMSTGGAEHILVIGPDQDGARYVRVEGHDHAVSVAAASMSRAAELTAESLWTDPAAVAPNPNK